jgi:hypothetical protein
MTAGQKRLIVVLGSVMAVAVGLRTAAVTLGAQTAWESYKNRKYPPSVDKHLTDPALIGAIDLHAHSDPDSYPRSWDGFEVAKLAQERGMRGVVLKNHWTETAGLAYLARKYATPGFEVFGAVSLDTPVGGVNPQAVRYMADVVGHLGRIVWMPTHDAEPEVRDEVRDGKPSRPSIIVSRNGKLLPEVLETLSVIAQNDLTLATGHVTPAEAFMIMREAKTRGVQRMIVTHPTLGLGGTMTTEQLQEAAKLGAYIEFTAGLVSREGPRQAQTFEAIRKVGPAMCFVASDSGLPGNNHPDALALAAKALRAAGFTEKELNMMFKDNPAKLVKLPVLPSK